ncbi:MAG: hypothetical protein AUH37_00010 [Candidatus Nitrososphaera sp. 13_1_40CM_48_12]|nr:MAG: hypothetical protein AUH37_00010 [Candidatus Nitrososphaera sp. 13_1_40CM_48_12]
MLVATILPVIVGIAGGVGLIVIFSALYTSNQQNGDSTNITNATLQNAIQIAESLNETKAFKKNFERFEIKPEAIYLTANETEGSEAFWRYHSQSFLAKDKPAILVKYVIKLDIENSAGLGVFIDPDTSHIYGTYKYQTQFG